MSADMLSSYIVFSAHTVMFDTDEKMRTFQ